MPSPSAPGAQLTPPARLHHHAFVTTDQEATRRFYEDVVGLPLVAT
jgi:glyoxylase I family protein